MVQWIKGVGSTERLLKERDDEVAVLRDQIVRLEAAAAKERAERLRVVDEKAAIVRDPAGAAKLLRDITRADETDTAN